jgi:hypothetical protein
MSEKTERAGLGKVIYKVGEQESETPDQENRAEKAQVEEAVEESFPASDPPSFAAGGDCKRETDSG